MKTWLGTAVSAVLLVTCAFVFPQDARGICRIVQPAEDSGMTGVEFDPTTVAVYVLAPDQIVDYECRTVLVDAGSLADAGPMSIPDGGNEDAGEIPPGAGGGMDVDSGAIADAGDRDASAASIADTALDASLFDTGSADTGTPDAGPFDAGPPDAGPPYDPSICPDGTPATPIRDTLVSMVLQPSVIARSGQAGLIMAVPSRADVHIAPRRLVPDVRALMRPLVRETVTVTESATLGHMCSDPHYSAVPTRLPLAVIPFALLTACGDDFGGRYEDAGYYRPGLDRFDASVADYGDAGTVSYERIATSESYDVTVLNASTVDALVRWLDEHHFAHDEADMQAFGHYLHEDSWFVAIHVHPPSLGARLALDPLVVTWRGDVMPVLHQLQYEPGGSGLVTTDALVLAPGRVESADDTDDTLFAAPTSLRGLPFGLGDGWITHLTIARDLGVEIADSTLVPSDLGIVRPTLERTRTVLHPAPCCDDNYAPREGEYTPLSTTVTLEYLEGDPMPPVPESAFVRRTATDCTRSSDWGSYDSSRDTTLYDDGCSIVGTAVSIGWVPVVIGAVWAARLRRRRR